MVKALYESGSAATRSSDQRRRPARHQMWAAQYFHFAQPRRWINSGGLGTMGFGLPAAMGAKVGCPDETVVCIAGDGSVQMNMQEMATCAQRGHRHQGVRIANNGFLSMVRQAAGAVLGQALQPGRDGPVAGFRQGRRGLRRRRTALRGQANARVSDMKEALAIEESWPLLDVRVTREENTYPMIPAGQPARNMVR